MATDTRALSELLAVLVDAGVAEFTCAEFSVKFPPPPPEQPVLREVIVSAPLAGKVTGDVTPEADDYTRLLGPNKPRLFKMPEAD